MGNVMLAISVAPALGPTVAGIVLEVTSWRWLFGLVLPIAAGVTVVALRRLVDVGEPRAGSLDVPSVLLAALGFGGLVYGLSGLGAESPATVPPALLVALGIGVVGLFAWRQRRLQVHEDTGTGTGPLLDLRVLGRRTYAVALALQAVAFLTMLGTMILVPLYLQDLRDLSPLATGLVVAPGGLAMGLLGPRVGRAFDRWGARPLVVPGTVGMAAALALLTQVGQDSSLALLVGNYLLLMVSLAAVMTPAFTLGLGALPPHLYSHGSSMLGTVQQVAAAVGTAVSVTVLSARSAALVAQGASADAAFVGGLRWAFGVSAALALVAVGLGLALPNRPDGAAGPEEHADAEATAEATGTAAVA